MKTWAERHEEAKIRAKKKIRERNTIYYQNVTVKNKKTYLQFLEDDMPQFLMYMQDCLVACVDTRTRLSYLFEVYKKYCSAIGEKPKLEKNCFSKYLSRHYFKKLTRGHIYYHAIVRTKVFIDTDEPVVEFVGGSPPALVSTDEV